MPYTEPLYDDEGRIDLQPHLTNTSFHMKNGEAGVRLLSELVGSSILSSGENCLLTASDVADIVQQMANILGETFRAALANPVHFQVSG